jgi:hypothetical protein
VSRRDPERLQDILDAIEAINSHVARGDLSDGLIFDAVRVRLIEIGEAIKAISPELLDTEPAHRGATSRGCATGWPIATSTRPTARSLAPSNATSSRSELPCSGCGAAFRPASSRARRRAAAGTVAQGFICCSTTRF